MKKKFRLIAGKKFYCNEKGFLTKDEEGNFEEVPETDTTTEEVDVEDAGDEDVEKMLSEARTAILSKAHQELSTSQLSATEAVDNMLKGIATSAKKYTKIAEEVTGKASYDVEKVSKGIADLATKQRESFSFTVTSKKDLEYLLKTTSEGADLTGDVIEGDRSPELTRDPVRQVFIESISDVIPNMTSDHLSYVEVTTESGAPIRTDELALISQKDFKFQEFKAYLKKITVMNKHSVEILKDAPQLVAAIKGWLQEDVNIETDNQLLNGTGVGENLSGVFTVASVLDAAEVGTKRVANANLMDVIRVAITKVAVYGKGKYGATNVLLNPDDADALDLTKGTDGHYILPPFKSADGTTIKGARIVENVGVPAGEFLVGDFRKLHIGTQGGVEIEMTNSDGDDFSKDILSVKLRRRVASYVRQNDSGAFWTGTIYTVIAALDDTVSV